MLFMAAAQVHVVKAASNFVTKENMFCGSACHCCSYLKEEVQASVNELKSMSEIIKILKDDLKCVGASTSDPLPKNACEGKATLSSHQCCNCSQLELQLKETLSELSSVKLVVEILHEEIKSLKNLSPMDSTADSTCPTVKSSISHVSSTLRPSTEKHTTCVTPASTRYAVSVANRYAPLSDQYEQQAFNDTSEQPPEFPPICIYRSFKRSRRNNTLSGNQPSLPKIHQPTNPNLPNAKKNEDGTYPIPTIVNGVTSVNLEAKLDHNHSDSVANSIRELSQSIKLCNKDEHVLSKKHKVILIGDSHIKGYEWKLKRCSSNM